MPDKYIARNPALAAALPDGEMMIMSAADSRFFSFSEVAAAIWKSADGKTPLSQIISKTICSEFEVHPQTAREDAEEFIDELSSEGMLLVSEQPISPIPPEVP